MGKWVLVSAAVHALAVVLLWRVAPRPSREPEPVAIDALVEETRVPPGHAGTGRRGGAGGPAARGARSRGSRPGLSLSDLGIGWARRGDVLVPRGVERGLVGDSEADPATQEGDGIGGRGGNVLGQLKGAVDYERLHDALDAVLDYPAALQDASIEGDVRAEIVIDRDGRFRKDASRFESSSRYLRVHVLRVVRRALAERFRHHRRGEPLRFRALFRFSLERAGAPFSDESDGVVGNFLSFRRQSSKLFGQWDLGPLTGYGPAMAVAVNPEWFLDRARDLTSKKARVDPLETYRRDPDW